MNHLHSIFFQRQSSTATALPPKISRNLASFRECHPDRAHQVYDLDMARDFLIKHFDKTVLEAFESLRPLAYKADLFRYCLLYELGGIYADVSLYFHAPVIGPYPSSSLLVFRDVAGRAPWILSNSLIAAKPGMPVFLACIERIIDHIRQDYYGVNALCPTGPNLLGAQLARTTDLTEIISGEAVRISRDGSHAFAYILQDGQVVAVAIKKGIGLGSFGVGSADNYGDFYDRKAIYSHNEDQQCWVSGDFASNNWLGIRDADGVFEAGVAVFGPYLTLPQGRYSASFVVSQHHIDAIRQAGLKLDACTSSGRTPIPTSPATIEAHGTHAQKMAITTTFELSDITQRVEVRLHLAKPAKFDVDCLEIRKHRDYDNP